MKTFQVTFCPGAEEDLRALHDFIAEEAGPAVAAGYIERIEATCLGLETFPLRGRARDEIRPGIRSLSFERRATIVYRVLKMEVVIIRIFYSGRDFERLLGDGEE